MKALISSGLSTGPDDGDQAGECPYCGRYRNRIEGGKMKPCYEWEREKARGNEEDDNDAK
jgi:hypothetical protein